MKTRKQLVLAIIVFSIVGFAFASYPFLASMAPSKRAESEIPRINIKEMSPGTYKITTHSRSVEYYYKFKSAVMIVKRHDGKIDAWDLFVKNGAVGMPDYHWWQVYYTCKDFGPTIVNGVIDETMPISCHDSKEDVRKWSIDGKSLTEYFDDLHKAEGFVEGDYFVLSRSR